MNWVQVMWAWLSEAFWLASESRPANQGLSPLYLATIVAGTANQAAEVAVPLLLRFGHWAEWHCLHPLSQLAFRRAYELSLQTNKHERKAATAGLAYQLFAQGESPEAEQFLQELLLFQDGVSNPVLEAMLAKTGQFPMPTGNHVLHAVAGLPDANGTVQLAVEYDWATASEAERDQRPRPDRIAFSLYRMPSETDTQLMGRCSHLVTGINSRLRLMAGQA